jgi:hypothetical protein
MERRILRNHDKLGQFVRSHVALNLRLDATYKDPSTQKRRSPMKKLSTLVLLLGLPAALHAQGGRPIELGLDAGLSITIPDGGGDNITAVGIPASRFRVGFFVSDVFEIEPSLSLALVSVGGETASEVGLQLGFVFHSKPSRDQPQAFFQVGGGFDYLNIAGFSDVQFGVGAGVGGKFPVGDDFAVRVEADYIRGFESDNFVAAHTIQALIGFSFFTN